MACAWRPMSMFPRAMGNLSSAFPRHSRTYAYDKTADSRSERTPTIEKPKSRAEVAAFFVRRGYVMIYQDCRGRYKSEGAYVKYLSDGLDRVYVDRAHPSHAVLPIIPARS